MKYVLACAAAVLLTAGCGPDKPAAAPRLPTAAADPAGSSTPSTSDGAGGTGPAGAGSVSMDEQGGNAGPGLCRLFSRDQIGGFLCTPVGDGTVTGPLRSACSWQSPDSSADVMITMALPGFYPSIPTSVADYRQLTGIGDRAASGTDSLGGMSAEMMRAGIDMIRVGVTGPANGIDIAVTILREAVNRTGGNTPQGAGPKIDQQGGGAGIGLCALYTQAEIDAYLGRPARAGKVTGSSDSGCTWKVIGDGNSYLQLEMLLPSRFSLPTQAPGYRELSGLGDQAYAAGFGLNAWNAVALIRDRYLVRVVVKSPLTADDAVTILTETLKRIGG
jgi:hypothetical protein